MTISLIPEHEVRAPGQMPDLGKLVKRLGTPRISLAVEKALAGNASEYKCADFLRRLALLLGKSDYRDDFFEHVDVEGLASLMQNSPPSNHWFDALYSMKLLPTPALLSFAVEHGASAARDLEGVVNEIRGGGFSKSNQLHVELEYSAYVRNGRDWLEVIAAPSVSGKPTTFEQFTRLPMSEDSKVLLDNFTKTWRVVKTAEEAVAVYELVKSRVSKDIPLLVIGNKRYGSYFVAKPLEEHLSALGVKVAHEYVHSYDFFELRERKLGQISAETIRWIAQNNPNIVVVDGTSASWDEGRERFPAAMLGYLYTFSVYNGIVAKPKMPETRSLSDHNVAKIIFEAKPRIPYRHNFWAPELTRQVVVGDMEFDADAQSIGSNERELLIVRSSSREGSLAYFDNPNERIREMHACLSSKGLISRRIAASEQDYVEAVQGLMKEEIDARLGKLT